MPPTGQEALTGAVGGSNAVGAHEGAAGCQLPLISVHFGNEVRKNTMILFKNTMSLFDFLYIRP